jgi:hypothetical protein
MNEPSIRLGCGRWFAQLLDHRVREFRVFPAGVEHLVKHLEGQTRWSFKLEDGPLQQFTIAETEFCATAEHQSASRERASDERLPIEINRLTSE